MFESIPNIITAIAGLITAIVSLWAFLERKKRRLVEEILNFKIFRKETDYFESISLDNAKEVKIICHTGKILIRELMLTLEKIEEKKDLEIMVLIKDPFTEHPRRRRSIIRACNDLIDYCRVRKNINCEIRFYSSLPSFRGLFIWYYDDVRETYLSLYDWRIENPRRPVKAITSFAEEKGVSWKGLKENTPELVKIIESIFGYYWGEGIIHTIVFDFDDTILKTSDEHIIAYIEAVNNIIKIDNENVKYLNDQLRPIFGNNKETKEYLLSLLLKHSDAYEVFRKIFIDSTPEDFINRSNRARQELRKKYLFKDDGIIKERKFDNIDRTIEILNNRNYPLYICSLTAEDDIEKILDILDLQTYFTGILGREAYRHIAGESIDSKTYMLTKISKLSGVPPYRILFVGDHLNDFKAAKNVGCQFIEARLLSESNFENENMFFTNYNQFTSRLDDMQSNLKEEIKQFFK